MYNSLLFFVFLFFFSFTHPGVGCWMKEEGPGPAGHVLSITPPTPIETRRRLIGPPLVNARNQLQNDHPPLFSSLDIFILTKEYKGCR